MAISPRHPSTISSPDLVVDVAENGKRLHGACARTIGVALAQSYRREHGERGRDIDGDSDAAAKLETRLQHSHGLDVVTLIVREHRADIERVCMRDVRLEHARKRERCMNVFAALGRVSALEPESLQRDLELHGDDGIRPAAQGERDGRAEIVELGSTRRVHSGSSGPCIPLFAAFASAR